MTLYTVRGFDIRSSCLEKPQRVQRVVLARMNMLVTLHLRRRSRLDANQEMRLLACWLQLAVPVVDERVEIHIKTNTFL